MGRGSHSHCTSCEWWPLEMYSAIEQYMCCFLKMHRVYVCVCACTYIHLSISVSIYLSVSQTRVSLSEISPLLNR